MLEHITNEFYCNERLLILFAKQSLSLAVPLQAVFPSLFLSSLLGLCRMCLPFLLCVSSFVDWPSSFARGRLRGFPKKMWRV